MAHSDRRVSLFLVAFLPFLAFSLACGGQAVDEPTEVVEVVELVPEVGSDWFEYDRWNDCAGFCERAHARCGVEEAGEGLACLMRCDSAGQWEGQEQPTPESAAIRDELICAVEATDCDQVRACLTKD